MTATDIIAGSLQQPFNAASFPTSYTIISVKPLHLSPLQLPGRGSGVNHKLRHLQTCNAMASGSDDSEATCLREGGSGLSSVSSLLRAVQEGGSNVVMQQVSSIKHFFMPDLPYAIITEIKKRVPLSFREDDEVEEEGEQEKELNRGQLDMMGPRCAWPRSKRSVTADVEGRQDNAQAYIGGPRCVWPRGRAPQAMDSLGIGPMRAMIVAEDMQRVNSSNSALEGQFTDIKEDGYCKPSIPAEASDVVQGPRCAWPRSTPRRMLATGVGLGLINYLCAEQGAPALAILLQSPLTIDVCTDQSGLNP